MMNKAKFIPLVAFLMLGLSACSDQDNQTTNSAAEPVATSSQQPSEQSSSKAEADGVALADKKKDAEATCYSLAVKHSGYDPANPPAIPQTTVQTTQPSGPTGSRLRGALRGAVIADVVGGDSSDGAALGAIAAGTRERRQQASAQQQAQAAANQQQQAAINKQQAGQSAFNTARAACLEGKGYTAK